MSAGLRWVAEHPAEFIGLCVAWGSVFLVEDRVYAWRLQRARRALVGNQQRWKAVHGK